MKLEIAPLRRFKSDQLEVAVYRSRADLGKAAGVAVAEHLRALLGRQSAVRAIFACAPSQNEFLDTLTAERGIAWDRVTVFHMDEYVGLTATHPASFRSFLRTHLTSRMNPGVIREIGGDVGDLAAECARYGKLLGQAPVDLVCLGIGENGHLAFNDPPVADFKDTAAVKVVTLDFACRTQQVNDGCFASLDLVPRQALTLTIPSLLAGGRLFCMVPGPRKASAVKATLTGAVTTACPASILRQHRAATLYVDADAAAQLAT